MKVFSRLNIPSSSRRTVEELCLLILEEGPTAAAKSRLSQRGRKPLMEDYTEQAGVAYRGFASGMSTTQTAVLVNEWRKQNDLPPISWSSVERFRINSEVIETSRRTFKKSGKLDESSKWSIARLAQAKQMYEQYEMGLLHIDDRTSKFPPLFLDGVAWWDEHHQQTVLGKCDYYVTVILIYIIYYFLLQSKAMSQNTRLELVSTLLEKQLRSRTVESFRQKPIKRLRSFRRRQEVVSESVWFKNRKGG